MQGPGGDDSSKSMMVFSFPDSYLKVGGALHFSRWKAWVTVCGERNTFSVLEKKRPRLCFTSYQGQQNRTISAKEFVNVISVLNDLVDARWWRNGAIEMYIC